MFYRGFKLAKSAEKTLAAPKLDHNFVAVLRFIWRSIKLALRFLRFLFDKFLALMGYEKRQQKVAAAADDEVPLYRNASLDTRSFQSFGSIRWVSDLSLRQIVENSRFDNEAKSLRIGYECEGKEVVYEFPLYGDLQQHELDLVGDVLATVFEERKQSTNPIKALHFVEDLGRFLNAHGAPESKVPGFTLDEKGNAVVLQDAAFDEELCYRIFDAIMQDLEIRERTVSRARDALWNQRDAIFKRLKGLRDFTPPTARYVYGTFKGRHIIDLDSEIAGGIFLSWPAKEAISIDPQGESLNTAYRKLLAEIRRITEPLGLGFEEKIMALSIKVAHASLPMNSNEALRQLRDSNRLVVDEDVPLDFFVAAETGDSEHLSLLIAFMLEKLSKEMPDYLKGKVSIDRNWFPGESHCWVRYAHAKDQVYIIDARKNLVGRLDDYSEERWSYERPSDLSAPRKTRPITL
ncbi:MAG: hypothetical protein J5J00_08305 [Deltaproteobacteria bacterium]|nr:hypothetical protein [Deltaproteobacteria bacterium]